MKRPNVGVWYALAAALLFGASTPLAKLLLERVSPGMLAGLLYLGSGLGLGAWRLLRGARHGEVPLRAPDVPWLAGAVLFGGVISPLLLMSGLTSVSAATASLLLNLEGVFTALLAWFAFKENFDRRVFLGMVSIVAGGVVLSLPTSGAGATLSWGVPLVVLACLGWALDNNLTRGVAASDPLQIAMTKGLVAGSVNVGIALAGGQSLPSASSSAIAAVVGLFSYGVSLTCFVFALRHIGTARTGAYFSIAPFLGVLLSIVCLGEQPTGRVIGAGLLMTLGVWLHLTEDHAHEHLHDFVEHEHAHRHDDDHHTHTHSDVNAAEAHSHPHVHRTVRHSHPHYPDTHHHHTH